jgi:hypothetical protein
MTEDDTDAPWIYESPGYGILRPKQILQRRWTQKGTHLVWTALWKDHRQDRPQIHPEGSVLNVYASGFAYVITGSDKIRVQSR